MTNLTIKIPVMVTAPLDFPCGTCAEMVTRFETALMDYNNLPIEHKVVVQYRRKMKRKIIKYIECTQFPIGGVPVVMLRAEEYKVGLDDLYIQPHGSQAQTIQENDRLGSNQNYALLYPLLTFDENGGPINRWCAFIYDDPSKDDADIKNTIKTVLTRILLCKVQSVLRTSVADELRKAGVIAQLKATFVSMENVENEEWELQQYEVRASAKRTKDIVYKAVPAELVQQVIDAPSTEGYEKKVLNIKVSDSLSYKYTIEEGDETEPIITAIEESNCYQISVAEHELSHIHEPEFVSRKIRKIIDDFIANN